MGSENTLTKGKVTGIISNLVIVETDSHIAQNEICYILLGDERLLSEVIKVNGKNIYIQAFESTRGLKVGCEVEFTGGMLEVEMGPGLLEKIFDGLQNDLKKLESLFLKRGQYTRALNTGSKWDFVAIAEEGDTVQAGDWLGEVEENSISHKIMVPFKTKGYCRIKSIVPNGNYDLDDTIAVLTNEEGDHINVTMVQKWPVKKAIKAYAEKVRPFKMLETGVRSMDCLNPMMEGGTGFVPGPFGTGKTVLQHAISKQASADVIMFAACGERANEIVEVFTEFPLLDDPHTGRKLMERTVIIANTSNMPVAAREASVYTAMTLAEYYRAMGLKVLILADSTSRWAQALREMSNRLEELPGPDAYPMDLTAVIANFYARAGYVYLHNNQTGSITFLGTVSPAGGNLKEPVTEATKKSARCFYALSQRRADSKRYPAIDPVESYSKYLEYREVLSYFSEHLSSNWAQDIGDIKDILIKGKEVNDQINILGDDGVPIDYHVLFWKAEVIDFAILQQDAFDKVDAMTPIDRQKYMVDLLLQIYRTWFEFETFEEVGSFFKRMVNKLKQMNYSEFQSGDFNNYLNELGEIIKQRKVL
ncbi:MAG: V-type ATP synthase subunit A [Bacteroidetes bacterium]|nr:V-type ATP synthase subunit A [Bacteroidota bacterium]